MEYENTELKNAEAAIECYVQKTSVSLGKAMNWMAEGLAIRSEVDELLYQGSAPAPTEAIYWYEQAARHGYVTARLRAAELLLGLGRASEAATLLRDVQSSGLLRKADTHLATVLVYHKKYDQALEIVGQRLRISQTDILVPVASALFDVGRSKDAMKLLQEGIKHGDTASHVALADRFARQARREDALRHYLIALGHGCEEVLSKIGRVLKNSAETETRMDFRKYGVTLDGQIARPWLLEPKRVTFVDRGTIQARQ